MSSPIPPAHPLEVREKAFLLYKGGKKFNEISDDLGVPVKTLRNWSATGRWKDRAKLLVQHKINPDEEREKQTVREANAAEVERLSKMTLQERQAEYEERMSIQAMRVVKIMEDTPDLMLLGAAEKIAKLAGEARKALKLEKEKPSMVINVGLLAQPVAAKPLPAPATVVDVGAELLTEGSEEEAVMTPEDEDEAVKTPKKEVAGCINPV